MHLADGVNAGGSLHDAGTGRFIAFVEGSHPPADKMVFESADAGVCHGVPQDPEAPDSLRISLAFGHCTKYWIRQLPDRTWELCQRNADGKEGPWKPLSGSKDGESDDGAARLTQRRPQVTAKIEGQRTQKRGKKRRSTSS